MASHLMVVLSNAKRGRDEEFNSWYSERHMLDTINELDGFSSARRFRLADLEGAPPCAYRYLAVYEIDDDQLETAYEQFTWQRRERAEAIEEGREPVITVSDSLDPTDFVVGFFSAITERVPSRRAPARTRERTP